nr:hypothetical protein [Tanacetum cinerariifolium]
GCYSKPYKWSLSYLRLVSLPNVADEAVYKELDDRVEKVVTTAASLDAIQASGNILKTQSTTMPNVPFPHGTGAGGSLRATYTKLIIKVKELEKTVKTSKARRKEKIVVSDDEEEFEDPSKQESSMIEEIDQDVEVTLVTPTRVSTQGEAHSQEDQLEDQLGVLSAAKVLTDTARRNVQTYTRRSAVSTGSGRVSTASRMISTAKELVSTAGASMLVCTVGMVDKGKGIMEESESDVTKTKRQQEQERLGLETAARLQEATYTKLIIKVKELEKTVKTSKARRKEKIVVSDDEEEFEDPSKQESSMIEEIDQDVEVTLVTPTRVSTQGEAHSQEDQLEDQLGVLSAAKVLTDTARRNVQTYTRRSAVSTGSGRVSTASRMISTAKELVSTAGASMLVCTVGMVDKGKGIMEESESDVTKTKRQQEQERLEERNKYSEVDQAKMLVDLINQRKRYFAEQKAEAKRKMPITQVQQRTYMSNYIKHMRSYTLKQLKKLSFHEIKELFKATMRSIKDFIPIESEDDKVVPKLAEPRSLKRDANEELDQGRKYWKIIRVRNHTKVYQFFDDMLKVFDSDVLVQLLSLVKERFSSSKLTDDKERVLWVELKRLFEPDDNYELWESQKYIFDIIWRLYDTCGVHHVSTKKGMDIYMLVEKNIHCLETFNSQHGVLIKDQKLLLRPNKEPSDGEGGCCGGVVVWCFVVEMKEVASVGGDHSGGGVKMEEVKVRVSAEDDNGGGGLEMVAKIWPEQRQKMGRGSRSVCGG